ncbi:PAS domain-containing protein [Marinobacter gelidimuriae]|uniref:PAS domain-containing protein n=1 Tax=Marinobacter gelidimuriae TaxID=2739064 RepID=UPI00389930B7
MLYCNNEFEAVSAFTGEELVGSRHNIVRHPDMPPPVYEHTWQCLKAEINFARSTDCFILHL